MLRLCNPLNRVFRSRKRQLFEKIGVKLGIRFLMYMILSNHGNSMEKKNLVNEIVERGYSSSHQACYNIIRRACVAGVFEDKGDFVAVIEPTPFVFRFVNGDILDSWKSLFLVVVPLICVFSYVGWSMIVFWLGLACLFLVVVLFVDEARNTFNGK